MRQGNVVTKPKRDGRIDLLLKSPIPIRKKKNFYDLDAKRNIFI